MPVAQRQGKLRVGEVREGFLVEVVQAYLREIVGLIPDHHNKRNCNLFAG